MIELITTAIAASFVGAAIGATLTRSRWAEAHRVESERHTTERENERSGYAAERARFAIEIARFRRICGVDANEIDLGPDRREQRRDRNVPGAIELRSALAALLGMARCEGAVIADESGLAYTSEQVPRAAELARLAPLVFTSSTALAPSSGPRAVREIRLVCSDTTHVSMRPLYGRSSAFVLVTSCTSRPPSSLALDAIVARLDAETEPTEITSYTPTTERMGDAGARARTLLDEIDRLLERTASTAIGLASEGSLLVASMVRGPSADRLTALTEASAKLRTRAAGLLRVDDVVSVSILLATGETFTLAPLSTGARVSLIATTNESLLEERVVDQLRGKLRRILPTGSSTDATARPSSATALSPLELTGT